MDSVQTLEALEIDVGDFPMEEQYLEEDPFADCPAGDGDTDGPSVILSLIQNSFFQNTVRCCLKTRWPSPNYSTVKGGVYQVAFDLSETATHQFLPMEVQQQQQPTATEVAPVVPTQRSAGRPKEDPNAPKAKYKKDKAAAQQALLPFAAGQQQFTFMPGPSTTSGISGHRCPCCTISYLAGSTPRTFSASTKAMNIKQHSTGSVRTQSFCKIDPREKATYLHLCGTAAENHLKNIETAKAVTKMQGLPREAQSN
ncbi:hypothetical protein quinque_013901 [Culex quinquefasciatus]